MLVAGLELMRAVDTNDLASRGADHSSLLKYKLVVRLIGFNTLLPIRGEHARHLASLR